MTAQNTFPRAGGVKGFFHLKSPPGSVWPPVPAGEVSQLWSAYQELDRTQWLSPEELESRQLLQVRRLVRHCYEQVPYYRRLLTDAGYSSRDIHSLDDLRRLPLLTRELYQDNFADLQAKHLPTGMFAAGGSYTSGTNGVPIRVLKTNRDALWWSAFYLRDLEWSNLDPRGRLAAIRLLAMSKEDRSRIEAGVEYPYWLPFCSPLLECGHSYGIDIREDPIEQLKWLRQIDPDYLISLPSNLEYLASLLQESGRALPQLKAIQAVGESMAADVCERIETGFGVPVKNLYSTTETGYVASPCPLGHGLHVHSENVLAEVLDAEDRPCRPGQTGRLVLTSLHNFLTPFLRYDILDDVTLAPGPCPCGRGLPLWSHVDGRRHPLLRLPNGRRKSIVGIVLGLRQVGGVRQFQVIQRKPDHVILHVVPDHAWTSETAGRMRAVVCDELEASVRVDVVEQSCLERWHGGKLKISVVEIE